MTFALWLVVASLISGCAGVHSQVSPDQRRAAEINAELGISYLRQNELVQAQRSLDRALSFDPRLALAHLGMGSLRERQGLLDEAMKHYRRALVLDPGNPYTQTNLGDLLCRQGEIREGRELLERAIADPAYSARAVALLNVGLCEARAGNVHKAEERMREALRVEPVYPEALYRLAELALEDGRPFQTRAFLSRLDSMGVVTPETLLLCYQAETQLGNWEDAERCAQTLRRDFGDSEEAGRLRFEERPRG